MITALGTAAGVLIALWNWARSQEISWMTLITTLFVSLIVLIIFYFFVIEPVKKKNKAIEDKIDGNFSLLKKTTLDIFDAVRELQLKTGSECLHALSPKATGEWAVSGSPLKLSVSGKKLLTESNIDKLVQDNIEKLIPKIEELKLNTAYDVQVKSFSVLGDFVLKTPELEKKIKEFAFNNPVVEGKNIGFSDIIFVGSILLRDAYLSRHPELK